MDSKYLLNVAHLLRPYFILFVLFCLQAVAALQMQIEAPQSPWMRYYQDPKHLPRNKLAPGQLKEIEKALQSQEPVLRFMSYNLLHDYQPSLEKPPFDERKKALQALIHFIDPDILGTQELFIHEVETLKKLLPHYHFFGRGEIDGGVYGEVNGIFYKKDRFEVLEKQFYFLSEDLKRGSADNPVDGLNVVLLQDRQSQRSFYVLNTHFSFRDPAIRQRNAHLLSQWVDKRFKHYPVVLMGDFNTFPMRLQDRSLPFHDGDYLIKTLTKSRLSLSRKNSILGNFGPLSTFTNDPSEERVRPFKGTGTPGVWLDQLLLTEEWDVLSTCVESAKVKGNFPSDHMPFIVDAYLKTK